MKQINKNYILKALTGGGAAAEAIRQIDPHVFSAYPITPQTPIIETFAKIVAEGKVKTNFILVESEHSALSVTVGATAAGGRAMTATASQGLALMVEVLPIVSGMRLPVIMNLSTRALSAPINIHNDHQDAMLARDLGWIQIFCQNNQEVYDHNFLALLLAEKTSLPAMICQDGFITSHNLEGVKIYPDQKIKELIGIFQPKYSLLNLKQPVSFGPLGLPDYYFEIKHQQTEAMQSALKEYLIAGKKLSGLTNRRYPYLDSHRVKDAEAVLITMGSTSGTTKEAVDQLRKQGFKVGSINIRLFRPFPYQALKKVIQGIKKVGVLDRSVSFGSYPPLYHEATSCLSQKSFIQSYIYGLGGRDVQVQDIIKAFQFLLKTKQPKPVQYLGLIKD